MKFSLLALTLLSTTAFAIGTNDLTGSFEVSETIPSVQSDAAYLTGATTSEMHDKSRVPASVDEKNKGVSHVTELTGTFE